MKDPRPVNLDVWTIRLPIAAYASILHRLSGVIVFVGIAVLLCLFDSSMSGEESFARLEAFFASPLWRFALWVSLSALAYHLIAGCKHLLLDLGIGETKEASPISAVIVLVLSAVLIVSLGVWIW